MLKSLSHIEDHSKCVDDYYLVKPLKSSQIEHPPALIVDAHAAYHAKVEASVRAYINRNPSNDIDRVSTITRTGIPLLMAGKRLFEWSSKSVLNLFTALWTRQFSAYLQPHDAHMLRFEEMTSRYFDWFMDRFDEKLIPPLDAAGQFASKKWPNAKKNKHLDAYSR